MPKLKAAKPRLNAFKLAGTSKATEARAERKRVAIGVAVAVDAVIPSSKAPVLQKVAVFLPKASPPHSRLRPLGSSFRDAVARPSPSWAFPGATPRVGMVPLWARKSLRRSTPSTKPLQDTKPLTDKKPIVLHNVAEIRKLRRLLGLRWSVSERKLFQAQPQDLVFVSIDHEGARLHRGQRYLAELGISTLDTRDIQGVTPGDNASNWIGKIKTQNMIVTAVPHTHPKLRHCLFGPTQTVLPKDAQATISEALKHTNLQGFPRPFQYPSSPIPEPRSTVLVGHSLKSDTGALKDLLDFDVYCDTNARIIGSFDTFDIVSAARNVGVRFRSLKLGYLVAAVGLSKQYLNPNGSAMGCHNAGNDAAYTLMTLLMFACKTEMLGFELTSPVSRWERFISWAMEVFSGRNGLARLAKSFKYLKR